MDELNSNFIVGPALQLLGRSAETGGAVSSGLARSNTDGLAVSAHPGSNQYVGCLKSAIQTQAPVPLSILFFRFAEIVTTKILVDFLKSPFSN